MRHDVQIHNVRKIFVEVLKKKFADFSLTFSIGGQISFDVRCSAIGTPTCSYFSLFSCIWLNPLMLHIFLFLRRDLSCDLRCFLAVGTRPSACSLLRRNFQRSTFLATKPIRYSSPSCRMLEHVWFSGTSELACVYLLNSSLSRCPLRKLSVEYGISNAEFLLSIGRKKKLTVEYICYIECISLLFKHSFFCLLVYFIEAT